MKQNRNIIKKNSKFHRFIRFTFRGIVTLIFRIRVVGLENEPEDGNFLVCSNHLSAADPVLITAALQHQVCFMAKKELFKVPFVSWFFRSLGAFPVDRGGADVGAVKNSISLLKAGKCVGMFPQGTRQPYKEPRETSVRGGAAMISYHANASVMPLLIHREGYSPKAFRRTTIVIGKPIPFSEFGYQAENKGEYARISNEIFDRICALDEEVKKCGK